MKIVVIWITIDNKTLNGHLSYFSLIYKERHQESIETFIENKMRLSFPQISINIINFDDSGLKKILEGKFINFMGVLSSIKMLGDFDSLI